MDRRIATQDDDEEGKELSRLMEGLDVDQSIALQVLMRGGTITAAAAAADVSRKTIYQWLDGAHPFRVALDLWKRDLAQCARTRLVMMTDLATSNVALALRRGDTRTAVKLLEKLGVLAPPPVGPTEKEVHRDRIHARTSEEAARTDLAREAMDDIGKWNDEFAAARMELDPAVGMYYGAMGQTIGDDPQRGVDGRGGRRDDRRVRDDGGGDGGSSSVHRAQPGSASNPSAADADASGNGEGSGGDYGVD